MVFVHGKYPAELGGGELQEYPSYLAVERHVSPSTQNQALNAIVFIYRHILEKNIDNELSAVRAKQRRHLPVVHSVKEIEKIFDQMTGLHKLMSMLIYGCGLRLHECLGLRIKDIDLEQNVVIIRSGKGDKDRRTVLPESLKEDLIRHIATVRTS